MKQNSEKKSILKKISSFVKPYKAGIIVCILVALLNTAIELALIYFFKRIIDVTFKSASESLFYLILIEGCIVALGVLVKYLAKYLVMRFSTYVVRDIQEQSFQHISIMQVSDIEKKHSGDMVSRLTTDLSIVQNFLQNDFFNLIYYPLLIISTFVYMFTINWKLLLFSTIITPFAIGITGVMSMPIKKYAQRSQQGLGEANACVQDSVAGVSIIKAYNLKEVLNEKYKVIIEKCLESGLAIGKWWSIMAPFTVILRLAPFLLCVLYGGYMTVQKVMTVGSLSAFLQLLNYLLQPLTMVPGLINNTRQGLAAADHMFEILDEPCERSDGEVFSLEKDKTMIEFDSVTFGYEDSEKILDQINFKIERGKTIALVGFSGSGKSTVFKLVCGFHKPWEGAVKLGKNNLNKWKLEGARKNIAFVFQDSYLFPSSVADNISFGNLNASREEIIEAAKVANIHDFIMSLPEAYDTFVGERGERFSGGQRQRIAIARAVLKKAPILLMDEPTSALDVESEALIQQAIEKLSGERTIVVIAHRLSTIKNVDEILVFDKGCIVERGTHAQLLEKAGVYTKLYNSQLV